jgi:hypothetical protein
MRSPEPTLTKICMDLKYSLLIMFYRVGVVGDQVEAVSPKCIFFFFTLENEKRNRKIFFLKESKVNFFYLRSCKK